MERELKKFNEFFSNSYFAEDDLLHRALQYLMPKRGKQLRPILVILSARMCGSVSDETYLIASAYELLHSASLIHDDVVDNSDMRRGAPSLNMFFDNKTAVLVGDYLMTKSFNYICQTNRIEQIRVLQKLSIDIIRGELLQQQYSHSLITEDEYMLVIRKKTASLFATCMLAGGMSAGIDDKKTLDLLYEIGENLGICFQIKDDIFDYTYNANIGKPVLNDITEGKTTLPLMLALAESDEREVKYVEGVLKSREVSVDDKQRVLEIVEKHQGTSLAAAYMEKYRNKALELLSHFPENESQKMLADIVMFSAERKS